MQWGFVIITTIQGFILNLITPYRKKEVASAESRTDASSAGRGSESR